ncbi:hypothetical protein ACQEVZ_02765 [Dactylosporangium sp. CA-152071]|uniref:hypothetical protein n=1 Tax=Dactylosporangium sp. CA-152071 TaxID=3239933 RepID=UPI003D8DD382
MQLTQADGPERRVTRLAHAGVQVLRPWPLSDATVTPPDVAWEVFGCDEAAGRVDRTVDNDDPDYVVRGNEAWYSMAREFGLFDADETFLLSVPTGPGDFEDPQWFEVRLAPEWDVFGRGVEEFVLGHGARTPAFVMHSKDGALLLASGWYQFVSSVLVVPRPWTAAALRRSAEDRLAKSGWTDERRTAARQWLALATPTE